MQHQHVIGQLTVEIQGATIATAADYQRACSQQVRSAHFLSLLNQELDRLDQGNGVWQIPRLELDLQIENDDQFGAAFLAAFRQAIAQQATYSNRQMVSEETNIASLALHFLEHGTLPWNATPQQKSAIHQLLVADEFAEISDFLHNLEQKAAHKASIWLRFLYTVGLDRVKDLLHIRYNFSSGLLHWLDTLAFAQPSPGAKGISLLGDIPYSSLPAMNCWYLALHYRELAVQNESYFKEKIQEALNLWHSKLERPQSKPGRIAPQDLMPPMPGEAPFEEAVFIQNSGLVLLAQFFPILFQRAGLVENGQFIDVTAQNSAIQLLQYLLTGEDQAWEHDLLLNKILCDIPEDMPVNRFTALSEMQRHEADILLTEAIRQWAVLKNTSVQGLREMFLERDGKLTRNGRNWRLQVERKAVDVLLERLPLGWGYSVIKLPWMEGVLYVEW